MTQIVLSPWPELPAPPPLDDVEGLAVFLDLDGTLAPIDAHPTNIVADIARNALLERLAKRLGGRLAVISGRPIADIDRILSGSVAAVAGIHGLERRSTDGRCSRPAAHPGIRLAISKFAALSKRRSGLFLEDKGISVALHFRGDPQMGPKVRRLARELADATGLVLQEGAMVVELRTPGPSKGDAIQSFLSEAPFTGKSPVFVGDDLTDEHGFAAVKEAGGIGILVGPNRPSGASHRLADVGAVLRWLACGEVA